MTAVVGNHLISAAMATLRLRGASYSGYEFAPIQGYWPDDSSGAQAGQPYGPNVSAMVGTWGLNALRVPVNQAAWLGQMTYDTVGTLHDADPRRRYRQDIVDQVTTATAAGMSVILVLHWSAPSNLAPMTLQLMADADNSVRFWTSVANTFKTNPDVMFELFNEPILTYAIKSGGTAWQVLKSGGVMDYAECTSSNGTWRQVFAMTITNALGEFRSGSVITNGTVSATVVYHDGARNRIYYRDATGAFAGPALTTLTRSTKPMIGRSLPAYAPSGTAANAVNSDYNNAWRTSGALPQALAIDISGVVSSVNQPITGSRPILFAWTNPDTYGYDVSRVGGTYYNLPADYTIEVNTAAGGGVAPSTGWVVVKTVTANTLTGRQHVINGFGKNWVRMNVSAISGSVGNLDCKINVDLWDASDTITGAYGNGLGTAVTDGVLFVGDSITAGAMNNIDVSGIATAAWGDTVFATTGHRPPYQNAGMPGWKTTEFLADAGLGNGLTVLEQYLSLCPYKYVTLALGANDAGGGVSPAVPAATYVANMLALAAKVALYGKVAIIPTITYSPSAQRNANVQALNLAMTTALGNHPEILAGADLYTYFQSNPTLIQADNLHPTSQGYSNLRGQWASWAVSRLYTPSATVVTPNAGWPTAGMQQMVDAVRATGATNVVLTGGISWSNQMDGWLANAPTDPLNQLACAWHAYPPIQKVGAASIQAAGSGHVVNDVITFPQPNTVYDPLQVTVTAINGSGGVTGFSIVSGHAGEYLQNHLPSNPIAQASTTGFGIGFTLNVTTWSNVSAQWSMPTNWPTMQTIGASYPVVIAETGEHSYSGLSGSPWLDDLLGWANSYSISVLGWAWDTWTWDPGDNVLIKDSAGTPTDGYGVAFKTWALSLATSGGLTVFDAPLVSVGVYDFDAPTVLGGVSFQQAATRGDLTVTGFAASLLSGFVAQPTLAELTVTGFAGGIVSGPNPLNAQTGFTTVTGFYAGTQAKSGGLHDGASDADGDPISFEVLTLPTHGTLQIEFNGAILYVPTRGFSGIDSFTWRPWAAGQPGNTVTVTFNVEGIRQGLLGEVYVTGYAAAMAGSGLDSPATLGEVDVTGYAATALGAGFVGQALLGELSTTGFVATLQGDLQALAGEVEVTGFAGIATGGWINQASTGADLTITAFNGSLVASNTFQALLGELTVTGFVPSNLDLPHGFEFGGTLGEVDVTGFEGHLIADLIAQVGVAGDVVGFAATLDTSYQPPHVSDPPPFAPYYIPLNHLPAGRILDRPTHDALMSFWASVDYRILTADEIEVIVGDPLPNPVIKRDWETGLYPVRKVG